LTGGRARSILSDWSGNSAEILDTLREARPVGVRIESPERRKVEFRSEGEALLLLSELADPEWRAVWEETGGDRPAVIERAFGRPNQGAWQAVHVPGPGAWTLRMDYAGRDVYQGLAFSGVGLAAWAGLCLWFGKRPTRSEGETR
jgi:hypothetical protein